MVISSRHAEDIEPCLALLRETRDSDSYPANWPRQAAGWLLADSSLNAWVAEEHGKLPGHLSLHRVEESATWPAWRDAVGPPPDGSPWFPASSSPRVRDSEARGRP
jgi:hypothetical protein